MNLGSTRAPRKGWDVLLNGPGLDSIHHQASNVGMDTGSYYLTQMLVINGSYDSTLLLERIQDTNP
jgi:hypothetical protein